MEVVHFKALTTSRSEEERAFECVKFGAKGNKNNTAFHNKHCIWTDLCSTEDEYIENNSLGGKKRELGRAQCHADPEYILK